MSDADVLCVLSVETGRVLTVARCLRGGMQLNGHTLECAIMIVAEMKTQAAQTGIGLGAAIAVVCSWDRNRSILWAILAGFLSWIYVIYFALTRE